MMCEVSKSTFRDSFPIIETALIKADFIAIDTEFTGLVANEKCCGSLFDTNEERYTKLRKSVSQFTISQIGVSAFTKEPNENVYKVQTFSIPLMPLAFGSLDVRFLVQTSSFVFLCTHNFDFNKYIYEGVSFMNEEQEREMISHISSGALFQGLERLIDEREMQSVCSIVAEWSVISKQGESFTLPKQGAIKQIKDYVLHTELRNRFPMIWTSTDSAGDILIEKISSDRRQELESENKDMKRKQEKMLLENLLGFTRVFRVLLECKKPVIGHNFLTDLLFLYEKFHKPLPVKYSDFKRDLHQMFPVVFDTKHMCFILKKELEDMSELLELTSLENLYFQLSSEKGIYYVLHSPTISNAPGFDRYDEKHVPHEAGYDAYMCGYVFLRLAHIVHFHNIKSSNIVPCKFRLYERALSHLANRVNVIRGKVNHIRLDGNDPASLRPPLLFVKERRFTQKLNCNQMAQWFSPYGNVDIKLMDPRRALVATSNFHCAKDILSAFKKHNVIYVTNYNVWRHSPVIRNLFWAGTLVSGSICAWILLSSHRRN